MNSLGTIPWQFMGCDPMREPDGLPDEWRVYGAKFEQARGLCAKRMFGAGTKADQALAWETRAYLKEQATLQAATTPTPRTPNE